MSENVLPVFFYMSFVVKSLNHSEFTFVYDEGACSNFIGLHAAVQLTQYHSLKRLSFSYSIIMPPLSKID